MEDQTTRFSPEWARTAVLTAVLRIYEDPDFDLVSEAELVAECITRMPAFDDLPEDTQDQIFHLLFRAVTGLLDDDLISIEEVIFKINPYIAEVLLNEHEVCILPKWGSA